MVTKKPTATTSTPAESTGRRPWKKKTPVEVFLDQTEKLKALIAEREEEVKTLKKQLLKFEEARKIFEA